MSALALALLPLEVNAADDLTNPVISAGQLSRVQISAAGAYLPVDLPVTITMQSPANGETAAVTTAGYTAVSTRVIAAGSNCPAPATFTIPGTGVQIVATDGVGLSGSAVTVLTGGNVPQSAVPANPVVPTSTVTGCIAPTLNLSWGIAAVILNNSGWGYDFVPTGFGSASTAPDALPAALVGVVANANVNLAQKLVPRSLLGVPNGVAQLDSTGSIISSAISIAPVAGSSTAPLTLRATDSTHAAIVTAGGGDGSLQVADIAANGSIAAAGTVSAPAMQTAALNMQGPIIDGNVQEYSLFSGGTASIAAGVTNAIISDTAPLSNAANIVLPAAPAGYRLTVRFAASYSNLTVSSSDSATVSGLSSTGYVLSGQSVDCLRDAYGWTCVVSNQQLALSAAAIASFPSPHQGLEVYDTTNHVMRRYDGGAWRHSEPISTLWAGLPPVGLYIGEQYLCTDCYSVMRASGDTSTGAITIWNGTAWVDAIGVVIQH